MRNNDKENMKYMNVQEDDLSSYCWVMPNAHEESKPAANGLVKMFVLFRSMTQLVLDREPHFIAYIIEIPTK